MVTTVLFIIMKKIDIMSELELFIDYYVASKILTSKKTPRPKKCS